MDVNPTSFKFNEEYEKFKELGHYVSDSKSYVSVFGEKANGNFTYVIYFWDLSEYEHIGEGFWSCIGSGGIYSSLFTVKSEAKRELCLISNLNITRI
ncbi:hypothetical protein Sps_01269 [Shewanella psychrophila]|uniref:Uncharacterized protein n=1 Tax=Shewanella psychrophila TaxID=225848 RepID=A0A1S6HLQ6_9GAMM|nr:hypothetical protein [Shewanella psychrophila]AQS36438.1 hypothetical protein Sps_01269 [Shewanella psychrophila]